MTKHNKFIKETDWIVNSKFRRKKDFYKNHRTKYNLSFQYLDKIYNNLNIIHRDVHTDLNYLLRTKINFNYGESYTVVKWFLTEKRIYMETNQKLMYLLLSLQRTCNVNYNWAVSMGRNGHLMRNITRKINSYMY